MKHHTPPCVFCMEENGCGDTIMNLVSSFLRNKTVLEGDLAIPIMIHI